MTEPTPSPEQDQPAVPEAAAAPAATHHNPVAGIISRMSIMQMTMAVILALFLWQWFDAHREIDAMRQELARRLSEMDGNNKANLALVRQEQETVRELSAKVALLEAHYAEAQSQRAALDALYQELSGSRDESTLSEVEQMLLIAEQQLQLSGNVKAALIAMQQASEQLKRMNRPNLDGLRRAIDGDMDKLRTLPGVDAADINSHLDNLIAAVDALPLMQEVGIPQENKSSAPATADMTAWQKLLREMWDEARQLVRIENMHTQDMPLLSPTQAFFLRENLKLRLLSARLALLSRDEAGFLHDLQAAQEWVARYFDVKSATGKTAVTVLQKLRASHIRIELPDISDSLDALRNYRASHEKPVR
jgi:uroporphyrin-III C-methyltransferase